MFAGHFAAGFALKGVEEKVPLGWVFLGTQFLDVLYFSFVLLGIETFTMVAGSHAIMEYPYTHSLAGAIFWSVAVYGLFRFVIYRQSDIKNTIALAVALSVFSHWILDFVTHTADMPLYPNSSIYLGLGLWNLPPLTNFLIEMAVILAGFFIYMRVTTAKNSFGTYGILGLLILLNLLNLTSLLPSSAETASNSDGIALLTIPFYFMMAGLAFLVDRNRTAREQEQVLVQ